MSRVSRVPYHQNVYDLLQAETLPLPDAVKVIEDWEDRANARFPDSMREFYTSEGEVCRGGAAQPWVLPLVDLWSEFSNDERAHTLNELFGPNNRPEQAWRAPAGYKPDDYPEPFFQLIVENQGVWTLYTIVDGTSDPPVFATDGEYGPWRLDRDVSHGEGWQRIGTFSEILYLWFACYYLEDFTPLSFNSYHADASEAAFAPPKPYRNGLWLRVPDEPFQPPVIDFLIDQFGEPERTLRPGDVTTYTFRPPGGTIRVTADDPALTGGLSAWWVHADTPERLAEFAALLLPWGTLRETLRADTDPARDVLKRVRGA